MSAEPVNGGEQLGNRDVRGSVPSPGTVQSVAEGPVRGGPSTAVPPVDRPGTTYIRVFQDRYSSEQTLVTIHPDGTVAVATREKPWHSWGPPFELKSEEEV